MLSSNERDILDAALDELSELYKPLAIDNSNCLPSGFEEINKLIGSCGYPKGGWRLGCRVRRAPGPRAAGYWQALFCPALFFRERVRVLSWA